MALPHLLKYVYTNGSDDTIRRGKKINASGLVELAEHDDLFGSVVFRVKDDNYSVFYKVYIQNYKDAKTLSLRCTCPYDMPDICRHEAASLMRLQEMVDKGSLSAGAASYDQRHTVARIKAIDRRTIQQLSSPELVEEAEAWLKKGKPAITTAADEMVKATVVINEVPYSVIIRRNEERAFDTSSDYADVEHLLCLPKVIVLMHLLNTKGAHYFDTIRNWDKEKNKLLEAYGYSLQDDLKGKFEFAYKEGKPFLRVLNPSIKRIIQPAPVLSSRFEKVAAALSEESAESTQQPARRLGIVFNFNQKAYPYFIIDLIEGEMSEGTSFTGPVQKLELSKYVEVDAYSEHDKTLVSLVRKLQEGEISKYVSRNSPFADLWENITQPEGEDLPAETKALVTEYLLPRIKKLFADGDATPVYVLPQSAAFKTANLQRVEFSGQYLVPQFSAGMKEGSIEIECFIKPDAIAYGLDDNEVASPLLFLYNHQLYIWNTVEAIEKTQPFLPDGFLKVALEDWPQTLYSMVMPLTLIYKVDFDSSLVAEVKSGEPEVKLYLQERGEYLVFSPVFTYKGFDVKGRDNEEVIVASGEKVIVIKRDPDAEAAFLKGLQTLHSNFIPYDEDTALALKGAEVLKNNWFFLFVDAMNEKGVPVYGFETLKAFRFNTSKPTTHIFISSHTDWFDAKVDILFGDQKVSVAEVKRALAAKQQYVQLNDGTLGILPDDWLKKYSLLFKVGEGRTDKLKLSPYHMSVIDELYETRNEEELTIQLEEKYDNLRTFNEIKKITPPENLASLLRPYQIAGYEWLNYLQEVGWGGILADDMGLGKTVQALSFLQYFNEKKDGIKALVVCPTTLIYNWEAEIKKFTPSLTYYIHHGALRERNIDKWAGFNIIITTYGTLRSDIKSFVATVFDYVVLDESQAIKNPASKVTKAASLLNARNRLCMSGTPLQNNTFDIYAQMNFLNPGMLGSVEFFKQEFAIPIDKFGEAEQKEHLKKILYPFILRRTKEQVAKDLPSKTEMVLFCEMEDEQRKIYDAYRNEFRAKIMGNIEEQGIQKSQLSILQGLMKLRQICDSPAILNEAEKFENHSIKLEELIREINENIGDHKALVFSQFLGMLALIRGKLDELKIPYAYFDGSTSAPDREKAIQRFQKDDDVRVFLISLKAGGVGLNLTAADYVYLVDPWWNPAVEQQAIDRTHRIGQTKNIFAYRMICKDTIEDKILVLQEKKRQLAKELIADDSSFVKALSKEDVEYLFS